MKRESAAQNYILFMSVFMLYFVPRYIEYTTFANISGVSEITGACKMAAYLGSICLWIIGTIKKGTIPLRYLFTTGILLCFFTYQAFIKNHNSIFVVLIFSLLFQEKYIDRYVKDILIVSCILYIITFLSCRLGFIENVVTNRHKFGELWTAGGNGFGYSGQMVMMLIPIVFMYYYHKRNRITWRDIILWSLINLFVFSQCLTIMGSALIFVFIFSFCFLKKSAVWRKRFLNSRAVKYSPWIFTVLTLTLLAIYRYLPRLGMPLDVLFNGRLNVGNIIIRRYGIGLFGTDFVNNTLLSYEILDSEYEHMLVAGGVIYTLAALTICQYMMGYAKAKKDDSLLLIFFLILLNAVFNNGIFNLVMNPFGIIMAESLSSSKRRSNAVGVDLGTTKLRGFTK